VSQQSGNIFPFASNQKRLDLGLLLVRRADTAHRSGDDQAAIHLLDAAYEAFDEWAGELPAPSGRNAEPESDRSVAEGERIR